MKLARRTPEGSSAGRANVAASTGFRRGADRKTPAPPPSQAAGGICFKKDGRDHGTHESSRLVLRGGEWHWGWERSSKPKAKAQATHQNRGNGGPLLAGEALACPVHNCRKSRGPHECSPPIANTHGSGPGRTTAISLELLRHQSEEARDGLAGGRDRLNL